MQTVRIDIERVQGWLFEVPRLRAMVGANTLLGETLRVRLRALALEDTNWRRADARAGFPAASDDDPLGEADNPAADAAEGVVSRDGGHFEAWFQWGASAFAEAAARLMAEDLPGLGYSLSIDGVACASATSDLSTELPVLAPCEWTGRGVGSVAIVQGADRPWVTLAVSKRQGAARRSEQGQATDLASLLVAGTKLNKNGRTRPGSFEELAGNGYLALIHADGNGVGDARKLGAAQVAAFFHRTRVLLRRATAAAIDATCTRSEPEEGPTQGVAPLVPLMLGGDDLLIACKAAVALPFVRDLCAALADIQQGVAADDTLTLGVGVVLARPKIPIQRLHDTAERLAASAKRRVRAMAREERRSVVDWAVYTTTWIDDPEEARRRDWVRNDGAGQRVLSRRPLDVLGNGLDSLQGLLAGAEKLAGAPRSQLRYLVDQLPLGRRLSELAFEELSPTARSAVEKAGVEQLWTGGGGSPWLTSLLDLVEVWEIARLGRADARPVEADGEMEVDA